MVEASVLSARCPQWVRRFPSHHAPHTIQSAQAHRLPPIFPHARQKCQANQGELRWSAGPRMRKCWLSALSGRCRRGATSCASSPSAGANPAKSLISFIPTGEQVDNCSLVARRASARQRGGEGAAYGNGLVRRPLCKKFSHEILGPSGGLCPVGSGAISFKELAREAYRAPASTADER